MSLQDPRTFFERLVPKTMDRIATILPEHVVVAFHITGPGGGRWQVDACSVHTVDDRPKDCEITCDAEDFMNILRGKLSPNKAFEEGRLHVVGDIGLLLKLRRMFINAA